MHLHMPRGRLALAVALVLGALCAVLPGIAFAVPAVAPPYDTSYTLTSLGAPPGVPTSLGGLTIEAGTTDKLLIGGNANTASGALWEVGITRDSGGHINGFTGTATRYADAAYNDGGVVYGPNSTLFLARWPDNKLGETKSGSSATDKIVDVGAMGQAGSLSSLAFVPAGFASAGHLKLASYPGGQWYDAAVSPDGSGTYDLTGLTNVAASTLPASPEGFVYVPTGSPQFPSPTLLLSEYSAGNVSALDVNSAGDPNPASARQFISGLSSAEGANIDPVTGDFLFSTFSGSVSVYVVKGFAAPSATVLLDSYKSPSSGGAAGPVDTGSYNLTSGQQYKVTVKGTYSAYRKSLMDGTTTGWKVCGSPDSAPQFPSTATTNGPVGQDAEFVFSRPQSNRCDPHVTLPYRYSSVYPVLEFDTGDGTGFHHVTPDGGVPAHMSSDHTYTYTVTGAGHALGARLIDGNTTDNYGQLQIKVEPAP